MVRSVDEITIGARLRTLRRWRGMTQVELAALAELSPSFVSMVEQGSRMLDRRSHIAALASALRVADRARPLAELHREVFGGIEPLWRTSDYVTLGRLLPPAIDELHWHIAEPADEAARRTALEALVETCVAATLLTKNLNYMDLAHARRGRRRRAGTGQGRQPGPVRAEVVAPGELPGRCRPGPGP